MKRAWFLTLLVLVVTQSALAWRRPTATTATMSAQLPLPPGNPQHPPQHGQPQIEVLVLDATMGDGGVAPEIAHLPHLRQPPFTGYSQISVVSRTMLPLGTHEATHALPNGDTVGVSLVWHGRKGRYSVDCTLTRAGRTSRIQFVASEGEPFFTVRSGRPDHAQVIGFIVRP